MKGTNHVGGNYRGTDEAQAQDAFALSLIEDALKKAVKQEAEERRREIANAAEDGAQ